MGSMMGLCLIGQGHDLTGLLVGDLDRSSLVLYVLNLSSSTTLELIMRILDSPTTLVITGLDEEKRNKPSKVLDQSFIFSAPIGA